MGIKQLPTTKLIQGSDPINFIKIYRRKQKIEILD